MYHSERKNHANTVQLIITILLYTFLSGGIIVKARVFSDLHSEKIITFNHIHQSDFFLIFTSIILNINLTQKIKKKTFLPFVFQLHYYIAHRDYSF